MSCAESYALSWMGREELESWEESKKIFLLCVLGAIILFLVGYFYPSEYVEVRILSIFGFSCLAGFVLFFGVSIVLLSRPIVIHKVNGVWRMKRE